jgi:outer membrane protein assembly factor BamE (lipoprotein component of BamABCDE complex)
VGAFRIPVVPALAVLAAAGTLTACQPFVATRGNLVDNEHYAQIQQGSSQDDVRRVLGSPTVTGTFDPNIWYYIGRRTEQTAFFTPDVVEQRVVKVRFAQNGTVESIDKVDGMDLDRDISPVDRVTPTAGRDLTFLQSFLGNLARPAKKKDKKKGGG